MPVHYDRLPQSSSEFDFDDGSEFKRKRPRSHSLTYIFAILRKTRRLYRPLYILIFLVFLLVLQVTVNTSYLHPPPFHPSADETVYIAANIIDPTLIDGAWGKSLLDLVDLIGKDRVYAEYKAACGTDFVRSWKYYDTFATRDAEGYSMGVPIFPWFSSEGDARSRKDVLEQRSAVRVKSCWGGIVAFDGRYFQGGAAKAPRSFSLAEREESKAVQPPQLPIRFRSSTESFWEASECCLVHADLIASSPLPSTSSGSDPWDTGIYMNPYVRVSYDATTHSRLWIGKRFERLAAFLQRFINWCAKMPRMNTRRAEVEGDVISERIWVPRN
ncbi:glycosyltransferase family 69 protein, partial [Oidiodendron maius Zn]